MYYQIYHAQELQNCYKNLILEEISYVPATFRTKVIEKTPSYEFLFHRQPSTISILKPHFSENCRKCGHKKEKLIRSPKYENKKNKKWNQTSKSEQKHDEKRNVREWSKPLDYLMYTFNQKKDDVSVDSLSKFVVKRPGNDETMHLKNYGHHCQPPRKRYHQG